nr:ATPase SWSAP1 [Chrysemys picta bellii]
MVTTVGNSRQDPHLPGSMGAPDLGVLAERWLGGGGLGWVEVGLVGEGIPGWGRPRSIAPSPSPPQCIQFLYPPSLRELLRLLASLHQSLPGPPALLLLDGLEQYLAGCPGPQAAARLSALLVDTASYFTGRLGADPQGSATCCQLIASMQVSGETEVEDYLCILQRYFPAQCWLCPDSAPALGQEDCGGDRTFRARLSQPGAADQEWKLGFGLDGEMRVSPVPWGHAEDLGAASDTDRAAGAEK